MYPCQTINYAVIYLALGQNESALRNKNEPKLKPLLYIYVAANRQIGERTPLEIRPVMPSRWPSHARVRL